MQTSTGVVVSVAYKLSNNNHYMAQLERWKTFGKNTFVVCIRSSHRLAVRCTTQALLNDLKISTATQHKGTNILKHACPISMDNNLYSVRFLSSGKKSILFHDVNQNFLCSKTFIVIKQTMLNYKTYSTNIKITRI